MMIGCCLEVKNRVQRWGRDYDTLQYLALILIYIQIGSALIGSLGALYNGVLLINLGIALFALVAFESSNQSLGRTYAVLLFSSIVIDVFWFILFSNDIWNISPDHFGFYFIFSVKLTFAMQIIGFSVRLSSSFLWIQTYRLGVSSVQNSAPRDPDYDLRNSFLSPTPSALAGRCSDSDVVLGGSIYDPTYYSSLFGDGRDTRILNQSSNTNVSGTIQQKSTIPTISPSQMPFVPIKSNEVQITDTRSAFTNSKNESVKPGLVHAKGSVFGSASSNSSLSSLSASPGSFNQPVEVPQFDIANTKSQPNDKLSFSPPFSTSLSVSPPATNSSLPSIPSPLSAASSAVPTLSVGLSLGKSLTASAPAADSSQVATSASFTLFPPLFPSNSLTVGTVEIPFPSNAPALFSDSSKLEPQPATISTLSSTSSTASHLLSDHHKTDLQPPGGQSSPSVHPTLPPTTDSLKTKLQFATIKSVSISPSPLTSKFAKIKVQQSKGDLTSAIYKDAATAAPVSQSPPLAFGLKLEPVSSSSPTVVPTESTSGNHPSLDNMAAAAYNVALAPHPQATSATQVLSEASLSAPINACGKNENLDIAMAELSLESLRVYGAGLSCSPAAPRANPFGAPFGNIGSNQGSSSFPMSVPSAELFRPASFIFSSAMPSEPSAPTNIGGFSSGFSGNVSQAPAQSAFGQPAHVGPVQQALISILGAFGQSRQLGGGLPGSVFASPIGFGGGFASTGSASGFSSSKSGGGFAGFSSASRGFAGVVARGSGFGAVASVGGFAAATSSGGGGFAGASSTAGGGFGGGFASVGSASGFSSSKSGGGFAGASSAAGGGFGAFSSQGTGGFSGFGGISGGSQQGHFGAGGGFGAFSSQGTGGFSGFGGTSGGSQQGGFGAFGVNTTGTGKTCRTFHTDEKIT